MCIKLSVCKTLCPSSVNIFYRKIREKTAVFAFELLLISTHSGLYTRTSYLDIIVSNDGLFYNWMPSHCPNPTKVSLAWQHRKTVKQYSIENDTYPFMHEKKALKTMISWNVSKNYQNLLILQLDCTIVPKYLTLLTSMKMTTISLNIMVI